MHKLVKVPVLDRRAKARVIHVASLIILTFLHIEGIVAISTGIWLIDRMRRTSCEILNQFIAASVFWLVAGLLCILVSIPGVLMTVKNRQYLRPPYFIGGFAIIIILEITVAVVATLDYRNLSGKFQNQLLDSISTSSQRKCWRKLQTDFECCGATSYENWIPSSGQNISALNSTLWGLFSCQCAKEDNDECVAFTRATSQVNNLLVSRIWTTSCYQSLFTHIAMQCNFLRILCPIVAISQIFACTFLGYVFKKILINNSVQIVKEKYMVQFSSQATLCKNSKNDAGSSQDRSSLHI